MAHFLSADKRVGDVKRVPIGYKFVTTYMGRPKRSQRSGSPRYSLRGNESQEEGVTKQEGGLETEGKEIHAPFCCLGERCPRCGIFR